MIEFFDMNGYAQYIWPAYSTALVLLAGLVLSSLRQNRKLKQELKTFEDPAS
jgi:heme exporter protein CcmD